MNIIIRVLDENEIVLGIGVLSLDGVYIVGGLLFGMYGIIVIKIGFLIIISGLILVLGEI